MLLSQEQRLNSRAYQDLLLNGHSASTTGNNFSGVSGDLLTEWFNKETKESAGPFRGGYSTQMSTINTWVRNCHIHVKVKAKLKEMLKLHTSFTHKELTPGGKKRHVKHVSSLKDTLRNYRVNVFDDGPARCISAGEEINENVIKGLLDSKDVGAAQFVKFTDERLVKGTVSIFDPIKKNNIATGMMKEKKKEKRSIFAKGRSTSLWFINIQSRNFRRSFQVSFNYSTS